MPRKTGKEKDRTSLVISLVLHLLIIFNLTIGLFNLLPLPALDGGRVLFLGINSLRSKDLNAKTEATVHMVGLALLLCLFVIVTFTDIKTWILPPPKP